MKNFILCLSILLNIILIAFLGFAQKEINDVRRAGQILIDENVHLTSVLLNSQELAMYKKCYDKKSEIRAGDGFWNTAKSLEIMYTDTKDLEKKLEEKNNNSGYVQLLTSCQNDLTDANQEITNLNRVLEEANKKINEQGKEIQDLKASVNVNTFKNDDKKDSKGRKKKVKKLDSHKEEKVAVSGDCKKSQCTQFIDEATKNLQQQNVSLTNQLDIAHQRIEVQKTTINLLEQDLAEQKKENERLKKENQTLMNDLGYDGEEARIHGGPVGCALSWSTAQPHAPPGV